MSSERPARLSYGIVALAVACALLVALAIARGQPVVEVAMLALAALVVALAVARASRRVRPDPWPRLAERLGVQQAVTTVLAETPSIADAMPRILEAVCAHLGWQWGALWTVDEDAAVLRFAACWQHPGVAPQSFERESRARTFARGIGLPGRVWEHGRPAWISDVVQDDNFPRAAVAAADGLRGAFAFPVLLAGRVLGVLEFFSPAARHSDDSLLDTLATLGSQIGQFLERTRAEDRLRAGERALAAALEREQAARAEVEAASRAKDEFLATVSHELRAPLTPLLLWTRMLQDGSLDDAARIRALQVIDSNVRAQTQLIDDLLDVSRIITGKLRLEIAPVVLATVIEAALASTRAAAEARGVEVTVALDAEGTVNGDAGRLQQLVWNLLSNAVKFTPRGGRVEVRLTAARDELELTVRDTGQGISEAFLPHVFERFRQADGKATRAHDGLGLGLAIVRHLVEAHGGRVRAESAGADQGTTFVVSVPRHGAASHARARHDTAAGADQGTMSVDSTPSREVAPAADRGVATGAPLSRERLRGRRVLLVDDDADTRSALGTILTRSGAALREAESAAAAMQVLAVWRPDVLISDLGLPDEDGYALLHRIRALAPAAGGDVPAVALTGYGSAADRARCIEAGFQRHILKPVDPSDLVDAVVALAEGTAGGGDVPAAPATSQQFPPSTSERAATGEEPRQTDTDPVDEALAFVRHELRQPLAAMRIWLNLLEVEVGASLSAEGQDTLEKIRASVTWMAELIAGGIARDAERGPPRT